MPKRLNKEKIEKLKRKIRRLQHKSSSEDSSDTEDDNDLVDVFMEEPMADEEPLDGPEGLETQELGPITAPTLPPTSVGTEPEPEPDLDPELLTALGEAGDETPKYGEKIHPNLAQRWQLIIKKGLTKEAKEKLLKLHLIPDNCTLLQAPKLNPEITAAVADITRNRDKKMEAAQQQLGSGITAVNRGLSLLLTSDNKIAAIKHFSDACRILSDLHYTNTQTRIKLVTPALSKQFLAVIQDSERDDTLFGAKLSEKIKASKAIEKQGFQIKKTVKTTSATSTSTTSRAGYHQQGNWPAPSRYPSSRGGRGGPRRAPPAPQRRPAALPQSRPAGQSKPRATQQ